MRREGPWLRLGLAGAGWQERENAGRAGGGGGRGEGASGTLAADLIRIRRRERRELNGGGDVRQRRRLGSVDWRRWHHLARLQHLSGRRRRVRARALLFARARDVGVEGGRGFGARRRRDSGRRRLIRDLQRQGANQLIQRKHRVLLWGRLWLRYVQLTLGSPRRAVLGRPLRAPLRPLRRASRRCTPAAGRRLIALGSHGCGCEQHGADGAVADAVRTTLVRKGGLISYPYRVLQTPVRRIYMCADLFNPYDTQLQALVFKLLL